MLQYKYLQCTVIKDEIEVPRTAPTMECVPDTGILSTDARICQEAAPNIAHACPIIKCGMVSLNKPGSTISFLIVSETAPPNVRAPKLSIKVAAMHTCNKVSAPVIGFSLGSIYQ